MHVSDQHHGGFIYLWSLPKTVSEQIVKKEKEHVFHVKKKWNRTNNSMMSNVTAHTSTTLELSCFHKPTVCVPRSDVTHRQLTTSVTRTSIHHPPRPRNSRSEDSGNVFSVSNCNLQAGSKIQIFFPSQIILSLIRLKKQYQYLYF